MKIYQMLLLLLLGVAGCARSVDQSQIPGRYVAKSGEIVEIHADGSYRHFYTGRDGKGVIEDGTWALETVEGLPNVVFSKFHCELPGSGLSMRGYFCTRATANWGGVRLWFDEDLGLYFARQ